jgi:hypothetical protein
LRRAYRLMLAHFGHLHWWPGETPFEVCVGAILTQNTSWSNVARAIANLKAARVLEPRELFALRESELAALIRPAGYFNVKARRLRSFLRVLVEEYGGELARLFAGETAAVRERLLTIHGVGPETADSMLPAARLERPGRRLRGFAAAVRGGAGREAPHRAARLLAGLPCATGHGRERLLPPARAALRGVPAETAVAGEDLGHPAWPAVSSQAKGLRRLQNSRLS